MLCAHGVPICLLFLAAQGGSQLLGVIEPVDLQRLSPKTFLECIAIPYSNWLKHPDQDHTKTAEELDAFLLEDTQLFIEVSVLCP